jgi:predicted small metal-binding protein
VIRLKLLQERSGRRSKMPSFKCKDVGMKCKFEVKDENQDELMSIIAMHGEKSHNIKEIAPDMMEKIKKAIKK